MKHQEPNYTRLFESSVIALQSTFSEYKKALNDCLKWQFFNNEGEFCVAGGYGERAEKVVYLAKEIERIIADVEFYRNKIKQVKDNHIGKEQA